MPDPQADQTDQPKRTAMAVAAEALQTAQSADDMAAALSEKVTGLSTRLDEITTPTGGGPALTLATIQDDVRKWTAEIDARVPGGNVLKAALDPLLARLERAEDQVAKLDGHADALAAGNVPTRDQVDGRIHDAIQPLHDELHELRGKVVAGGRDTDPAGIALEEDAFSDRVEDLVKAHLAIHLADNSTLADLGKRLADVETAHFLTDQVETIARSYLNAGLRAAQDANVARFDAIARELQGLAGGGTVATETVLDNTPRVGGVHAKVLEVMRLVTAIGKDKFADQGAGGKFKFRGIDDAMDAVGHALRQVGLVLETDVISVDRVQNQVTGPAYYKGQRDGEKTTTWTTANVVYQYTFVDPTDGSRQHFQMAGEGRDASDKATSKAGSMALKYGLFQALMIPVSEMPDADTESPAVEQFQHDRPAEQQPTPNPPRTPAQTTQRAADAVKALQNLHRVPADQRSARWQAIVDQCRAENIGLVIVDGSSVQEHARSVAATLGGQHASPPAAAPPSHADEPPPWDPEAADIADSSETY